MNTLVTMIGICLIATCAGAALGQAELSGWGNLRGIRVDGELVPITTSIVMAAPGWTRSAETQHWRTRRSTYTRDGDAIVCTGEISIDRGPALSFRQTVINAERNGAVIDVELTATSELDLEGVYFFVKVPIEKFGDGTGELAAQRVSFATTRPANDKRYAGARANRAKFVAPNREVEISFDRERLAVFQDGRADNEKSVTLFVALHEGKLAARQTVRARMTIRATVDVDHSPATATIDATQPGAIFEGIGGNFCWGTQSRTVPFFLDNLPIAWARVSFPMQVWQPRADQNPTTRPIDEQPEEIRECLRIARELNRRGIPIILSIWNAPEWALERRDDRERGAGGSRRASRIDPDQWPAVAESIGRYLLLFKQHAGAEPAMFSFNESNLGINVLMSPEEHRDMIKYLGARFRALGLKTQMLLGDANEPRAVDYVTAALGDPEALRYVGMVSYHSWNGGTDEQLTTWREHARRAKVPLIVAEAGNDPDAHQYRAVLAEPWYAIEAIENYLRCMTFSQPASILHWQLTPDYGFMTDDLRPTRRWWQFKQLADLTPRGARHLPTTCDQREITVSALRDDASDSTIVHIVNRGAARQLALSGFPVDAQRARIWITDAQRDVKEVAPTDARNGRIDVKLPTQSFVTIIASKR